MLLRAITFLKSVDARLALPAVAVAVAISALWWTLLDRIDREERFLDQTTRQHTAVLAQLVEEQAVATFRRLDDMLVDIAYIFQKDLPLGIASRHYADGQLAAAIRVFDETGRLTLAVGRTNTRDPMVEHDEFRLHEEGSHLPGVRNGFVIGTPFLSPGTRDLYIPVSRLVDAPDSRFRGIVVADVPAETLSRFYRGLDLPPGSTVALARADGTILARQNGQAEGGGRGFAASRVWPELARSPTGTVRAVSPVDEVERITSYRLSAQYPVVTMVGESVGTVFGPWRHNRLLSIAWAGATTVVILLFTTAFLVELVRRRSGDRELRIRNRAMAWSGDGILVADATRPGTPVVYANPSFERLMDLEPGNALGRRVLGVLERPIGDPSVVQPLRDGIGAARDVRMEFRRSARTGGAGPSAWSGAAGSLSPSGAGDAGAVWLELRASPVRDDAGRLVSLIAIVRDVTEHKTAEAALAEARREADRANVAKSKFLAAASHDLRQPVQSLLLLMEVLSARAADDATRKVLGTMDRALNALKMLLDGLLDVSRLEAGAVEPHRSAFPVSELLDRVAANSRPVAVRKGLVLHIMPCSAHVDSDPMLLGRILQNLVENALRYTARGRILVGCRRRGGVLRIEVWDTGIGIPADRQDDIFHEFVQVGNASRDRDQGLGLGLAVVRRMARILGHRVTLRSEPGRGSVFRVEVPLVDVAAAAVPKPGDAPAPPQPPSPSLLAPPPVSPPPISSPQAAGPVPKPPGTRILVVEDDPIVRDGFRMMMTQWGHGVETAETFEEALALVAGGGAPDVIVTDYRLDGGRTGTEIIRDVRRAVGFPIPGILVTGDTAPERLAEAEAGKFRVLHKPVMAGDLQRAVAEALEIAGVELCVPVA